VGYEDLAEETQDVVFRIRICTGSANKSNIDIQQS